MAFSLLPCLQDAVFFVYNFWQQLLPERDGVPQATTRERKKLIVVLFLVRMSACPVGFLPLSSLSGLSDKVAWDKFCWASYWHRASASRIWR